MKPRTALLSEAMSTQEHFLAPNWNTTINQDGLNKNGLELLAEERTTDGTSVDVAGQEIPPPLLRKLLFKWRTLVSFLVVLVVGLFIIQQFHLTFTPTKIVAILAKANLWLVLAALLAFYGSLIIRSFRWKVLLEQVGYQKSQGVAVPGLWQLTKILFLSWFANVLVPAKLGDVYRAYLLRQEAPVSASRTLGTVLAERILDLVALVLLFIGATLALLRGQLPTQLAIAVRICLVLVCGITIWLLIFYRWGNVFGKVFPRKWLGLYEQFRFGTLGSFRRMQVLMPLTILAWLVESMRFLLIALSTGLLGGDILHVLAASLVIALGESLLTTIPLTSGGIGFVEAGMFALILLFTPRTTAVENMAGATIVLDRLVGLGSILVLGGLLFGWTVVRSQLHIQKQKGQVETSLKTGEK